VSWRGVVGQGASRSSRKGPHCMVGWPLRTHHGRKYPPKEDLKRLLELSTMFNGSTSYRQGQFNKNVVLFSFLRTDVPISQHRFAHGRGGLQRPAIPDSRSCPAGVESGTGMASECWAGKQRPYFFGSCTALSIPTLNSGCTGSGRSPVNIFCCPRAVVMAHCIWPARR
jgi:hypothetical protein